MTVIPVSLLTRILEQKMNIPVRKLDKAIEIDLAVKGNDIPKVIIDREIHANIQIKLPGSRLPVLLRNVKISVTTHEMDVVLLGRDLLDTLGFNFKQHLTERYNEVNDLDCSKAESQEKNSIMAYTSLTHGDTDDDPIEPPVDLKEQFGDDDPGEIDEILDKG